MQNHSRIITITLTIASCLAIACGVDVRFTPASAQDGGGGAGGAEATGGGPGQCDCPTPPAPRMVELAREECTGGFAGFGFAPAAMQFRERGMVAWVHATGDELSGMDPIALQWDNQRGLYVRCPLGEDLTVQLWGLE